VIELPYQTDPRDLAAMMASCDAFVHANDAEPFGLIVLEAMASGLPVVGVASGGVAESVDSGVGELARRSTAEDFAEAVEALFARDVAGVGAAARERAATQHGWDRVFSRLSGVYAELTGAEAFGPQSRRDIVN
jgi:alpha-1,6-mannosyltransferase